MSLSGNLGFVSLDEILRLLTRSSQQGSVDVRGERIHGRIFITKDGVGLATTADDEGLHRHLLKSGFVDDAFLNDIEAGKGNLGPVVEKSGGAIVELIREMTVESIYQLGLNGVSFDVNEGVKSHYTSPNAFELEELLADSKKRLTDWVEVSRIVEDLKVPVTFIRDLGDREDVKIDNESWRVLSEVGSGASVSQMADELGTTEFWTARIAARLIEKDLVAFAVEETSVEEPIAEATSVFGSAEVTQTDDEDVDPDESWWKEPESDTDVDGSDTDVVGTDDDSANDESADEEAAEVTDPAKSRPILDRLLAAEDKDEAQADDASDEEPNEEADEAPDEAQVAAASSQIPSVSASGDSTEVEEDTEAFLEKVFSELETTEEPEDEGYGLLRRRRMGAIRDHSTDA